LINDFSELRKTEIRLIAIDLDGTMLNEKKELTDRTKKALVQACKEGILIIPATGRHYNGIPKEIEELEGVRYFLTTNGAGVYDKEQKKFLYEDAMSCEFALRILKELMQYDILIDAFIGEEAYRSEISIDYIEHLQISEELKRYICNSRNTVPSLYDFIKENQLDVHKFTLNFKPDGRGGYFHREQVLAFARKEKQLSCVCGGINNLELTNFTATKGNALLRLEKILNIPREQMMAIGDSENDYTMIQNAGIGVAMKNAEQVVRKAADFITQSNEEDGVACVVEQYLKN